MHIAMLAGEASGDQLGAELIKSLRRINPCIRFDGVGGPLMIEQGFNSLLPMEDFSVMGISEIIFALPRLFKYKKQLVDNYHNVMPDAFIGIDYPEFNLSIEKQLKDMGVYTVHYVSPSVWAWRKDRINKIKRSVNMMLTLFDFEKEFYEEHGVSVVNCGHPLVDLIPEEPDFNSAKMELGLNSENKYLAIMPGSRISEIERMLPIFISTVQKLNKALPKIHCLIPAANKILKDKINSMMSDLGDEISYEVTYKKAKTVMAASDAVLLTSGTVALEAMLLQKPMVVSYKVSALTAFFIKRMINLSNFSLPNLLADHPVVPEFIQDKIDPLEMSKVLYDLILPTDSRKYMVDQLIEARSSLIPNAANNAAKAIYNDMMFREIVL